MTDQSSGQQEQNAVFEHGQQPHSAMGGACNSSMILTIGGAATVIMTILGLAGMNPMYMAAIATVAVATALAVQGISVGNCYARLVSETGGRYPVADLRTGLTAEFIAGATGIVLGVLALLQIEPATLTAVAAIVLGSGVLLSAGIANRLAHFAAQKSAQHPLFEHMVADAVTAAAGAEVLVGGGAIVLGVIALAGAVSYTLTLVALLALGASCLMTGGAVAGKIGGIWAYH
jgi:hypothetical protein